LTSLVVVPGIGSIVGAAVGGDAVRVDGGAALGGKVAVTKSGNTTSGVEGLASQPESKTIRAIQIRAVFFIELELYPKKTHPRNRSG